MSTDTYSKYGLKWKNATDPLEVEMWCIRKGHQWIQSQGRTMSFHFEQMRKIIWPELDVNRWHTLCTEEIFRPNASITVLMGPKSSGKTHEAAWSYLCDYFCFPEETCVLVSSTTMAGLRKRVWGEISSLWERAVERFDFLPGNLIDSAIAIATDNIDAKDEFTRKSRDMRKGIFGIPCIQGGKFVGLARYIGIKQKRMRLIADESSAMSSSFLSAFSNLNANEDFQAIVLGNPNDILDPLGRCAEPREGWTDEYMDAVKTRAWDTRFMGGRCVNLVGTDSPNFDLPQDKPIRYKYLISRKTIAETLSFFAKDSVEYYSQCVGTMKIGTMARRVLTRQLAMQFKAMDDPVWRDEPTIRLAALDAAYGGDRAVLVTGEIGLDIDGKQILACSSPVIVPISVNSTMLPEDQLALFCRDWCERHRVPPENFFHDSTGRGTLGTALARIWSAQCNPVEFGGKPTERPVSADLFVNDKETGQRRLKLASEHYSKWVTEAWFSVRYAIEASQIRNLPEEALEEGCLRQWDKVRGDKIEIETKQDMKERVGRSPDMMDAVAILVEGARRRGFMISKLAKEQPRSQNPTWIDRQAKRFQDAAKEKTLELA